jgi:hypothetical protein
MNYKLSTNNNSNSNFGIKKGKIVTPISLTQKNGTDEIEIKSGVIQHTPNKNKERDILYVFGQSGSGKSYYVKEYAAEYKKMYPKNDIFLFTTVDDVSTIDEIKKLIKIDMNKPEFLDIDIPLEEFKDSLVIFDDVDNIDNKALKKKLWSVMGNLLTKGRHYNVSAVVTYHVSAGGNETKLILNESNSLTFFPAAMGGRNMKYILDGYLGLDKAQIKKIKCLDSRWITVLKTYPKVVLYEGGSYILRND